MEPYRPRARLRMRYADVAPLNPRLIYASMTGYGEHGPDADQPGFDSTILNVSPSDVARQAYDGLMANKRAVLPGLGIKIVPLLLRLFPRGFILWAVGRFQQRKR